MILCRFTIMFTSGNIYGYIFNISIYIKYMNKPLIGNGGYLFVINDSANEIEKHSKEDYPVNMHHINEYKTMDNFMLLIYPDKSYIYSKYLPDEYNVSYRSVLNKYMEKLNDKLVDLYDFIKNEDDIYYKTDTHINLKGNYAVFNVFCDIIKNKFNIDIPKLDINNLDKTVVSRLTNLMIGIGDLTWKSNLGNQTLHDMTDNYYSEKYEDKNKIYYSKTYINENTHIKLFNESIEKDEIEENYNKLFDWNIISKYIIYKKNMNCNNNLRIVIFYDSFLAQAIHLFMDLFQEVYFIKRIFNRSLVNTIKPDYTFEFRVERFLF